MTSVVVVMIGSPVWTKSLQTFVMYSPSNYFVLPYKLFIPPFLSVILEAGP